MVTEIDRKKNPCYQCEKRKLGCHSECIDYLQSQKMYQEKKEAIKKQKEQTNIWYWGRVPYGKNRANKNT